jgi:3-hydroxyisobutyrate dehydrogenase-like beta-hydroxyacid dehydrogenase
MGRIVALGLKATTDISKLFHCDVVISMLPDDNVVRDVVSLRKLPRRCINCIARERSAPSG